MACNLDNWPSSVKAKWPMDDKRSMLFSDAMQKRLRIRDLMLGAIAETGMSIAELQRRSGVSYDVLNKLKRREGASTSAENAARIAAALGISSDVLDLTALDASEDRTDLVPIYNVEASAGHGALIESEMIVDQLSFPPGYLRRITSAHPRDLAIIGVKGDSMSPTLADGDVVMIDTQKRDLSFDGLFVLRDGGASLLVKRIGRGGRRGTVTLISDNRTYPSIERDATDIEVVGKVVWKGVRE